MSAIKTPESDATSEEKLTTTASASPTTTSVTQVSTSSEPMAVPSPAGNSANSSEPETLTHSPSSTSIASQLSPSGISAAGSLLTHSSERKYTSENKTFHRRFSQVNCDEELVNYFSCALLADILLQGYLYISDNYFAFYSNIFGYKTKLLIPISEVIAITREKTVKIIPNAVGIETTEGKYVFGSLISRETTYRVMYDVWSKCIPMCPMKPKLRSSESIDTGSESPSTPTTGEPDSLKCKHSDKNGNQGEKRMPKIVLPDENGAGYSSKSNSLKRNRNLSPHLHKFRRNNGQLTDSESDMNSADEESPRHSKYVSKFPKSRGKKVQEYVSLFVKTFSQRCNTKSILLSAIIVTLILLVISAVLMLYKVNIIHHYLSYISPHKISPKTFYSQEMQRINDELKTKLVELSRLKQSLHDLLVSIDNIPRSCLSSNNALEKPFASSEQCGIH